MTKKSEQIAQLELLLSLREQNIITEEEYLDRKNAISDKKLNHRKVSLIKKLIIIALIPIFIIILLMTDIGETFITGHKPAANSHQISINANIACTTSENYPESLFKIIENNCLEKSQAGDGAASMVLFDMYDTKKDSDKKIYYLKRADQQGDDDARGLLGLYYAYGIIVDQNYFTAFIKLNQNKNYNNIWADVTLGQMYLFGIGTQSNTEQAIDIFTSLSKSNDNAKQIVGKSFLDLITILTSNTKSERKLATQNLALLSSQHNKYAEYIYGLSIILSKTVNHEHITNTDLEKSYNLRENAIENGFIELAKPSTIAYIAFILSERETFSLDCSTDLGPDLKCPVGHSK